MLILGHKSKVSDLQISPQSDTLLSSGHDGIRIWDLGIPKCRGVIKNTSLAGKVDPVIAFDQAGLVFAIGGNGIIALYDLKKYDKVSNYCLTATMP